MTSTAVDAVVIQNLERALIIDQARHGEYIGNSLAEVLHGIASVAPYSAGAVDATTLDDIAIPRVVGLGLVSFGTAPRIITINPGAVVFNDGAQTPAAGFSAWRIGILPAAVTVAYPGADNLWYLIEARVVETTVTESRDILTNAVTRTYTPQSVTVGSLKRLAFNVKVGTTSIPSTTAGYVPLYAFLNAATPDKQRVVDFRQAGGTKAARAGVALSASIPSSNMKPTYFGALAGGDQAVTRRRIYTESQIRTSGGSGGILSNQLAWDLRATIDGIECVSATTPGTFVPLADFIDTGGYTTSRWHYLYLAPYGEAHQVGNFHRAVNPALTVAGNCILIASLTPPNATDQRNPSALTIPAPLAGAQILTGRALCVGAVFYATGGWLPTWISGDEARQQALTFGLIYGSGFSGNTGRTLVGVTDALTQPLYPVNIARHVSLQLGMTARTPSQGATATGGKLLAAFGTEYSSVLYETTPNEPNLGSVLVDPSIQEEWQQLDIAVGESPMGAAFPVAAGAGVVAYKLATRQATGVPYTAPNGQMQDIIQSGGIFGIRCHGWRM